MGTRESPGRGCAQRYIQADTDTSCGRLKKTGRVPEATRAVAWRFRSPRHGLAPPERGYGRPPGLGPQGRNPETTGRRARHEGPIVSHNYLEKRKASHGYRTQKIDAMFLVTGGAGLHRARILFERLVSMGESVRVLDDLSTGKRANIEPFLDRIDFIEGSITDPAVWRSSRRGGAVCLPRGGHPQRPQISRATTRPTTHRANVEGPLNILIAARDAKVKRPGLRQFLERLRATSPRSQARRDDPAADLPLRLHKRIGEQYLMLFHAVYGLEIGSAALFQRLRPRQTRAACTRASSACSRRRFWKTSNRPFTATGCRAGTSRT